MVPISRVYGGGGGSVLIDNKGRVGGFIAGRDVGGERLPGECLSDCGEGGGLIILFRGPKCPRRLLITITHKRITEPNFIIFELFSVILALWLPNRIVSGITWSR